MRVVATVLPLLNGDGTQEIKKKLNRGLTSGQLSCILKVESEKEMVEMKKDYSIRYEIEVALEETFNVKFTEEQVDRVLADIESSDTLLNVISLFVLKGIEEVAKEDNIELNEEELEYQYHVTRLGIDYSDI